MEPRPDGGPWGARLLVRLLLSRERAEVILGDLEEEARLRPGGPPGSRSWYWRMAVASVWAVWGVGLLMGLDSLGQDVRLAVRSHLRRPGLVAAATLTLALAIGANVSVFSLANAVFLRPVQGVSDPATLVQVQFLNEEGYQQAASLAVLQGLQEGVPGLTELEGYNPQGVDVAVSGRPGVSTRGEGVTSGFFDLLGVRAQEGRLFAPEELDPLAPRPVVVISGGLRERLFGAHGDAVGRALSVNGFTYTVIGVVADYRGLIHTSGPDLWFNAGDYYRLRHDVETSVTDPGAGFMFQLVGRLAPGVDPAAVEASLRARGRTLAGLLPETAVDLREYRPTLDGSLGLPARSRGRASNLVRLLAAAVGLVLLIACANVANLLVLRSVSRRGETAVRAALGASRRRLLHQQLLESLVLAVPGGVLGVAVAALVVPAVAAASFRGLLPPDAPVLDGKVLAFAVLATLGTGILFGVLPALAAVRADPGPALQGAGTGRSGRSGPLRFVLSAGQIGLSLTLVVGALLLVRTLDNLTRVELGFRPDGVWVFSAPTLNQGYTEAEGDELAARLLRGLQDHPSVETVGLATVPPFGGARYGIQVLAGGPKGAERIAVVAQWVAGDYFGALGIPVLEGRSFTAAEGDIAPGIQEAPLILSESLARRLFGDAGAVGRTVTRPLGDTEVESSVVGVVGDARMSADLTAPTPEMIYMPLAAHWGGGVVGVVRGRVPPEALAQVTREAVAALDPDLPVSSGEALAERVRRATASPRALASLLGSFAGLAALLAGVGLYGVLAHGVAERRRELAVRMTLGASGTGLVRRVVGSGARIALVGLPLGLGGAWLLGRVLDNQLFGVDPVDPLTYGSAAVGLFLVAVVASALPARAVTRLEAAEVLREE